MRETKRIIVTGATGLIGKRLCSQLTANGYLVVVFSRDSDKARTAVPNAVDYVQWTPTDQSAAPAALEGAHGVVHLAGAPVFGKRWSSGHKRDIRESRILGTRGLVDAMAATQHKPQVFVSGSAVGYYGFRHEELLDESQIPGGDFLAQVCIAWEQEARRAQGFGIRTVLLRTGIVLDRKEGALPQMMLPLRLFVGGPILPGKQWFPWVHIDDVAGLIMLALEDDRIKGALNATAPEPLTNRAFTKTLGNIMHRPVWAPVPGIALRVLLGGVAGMLTKGQRVIPQKAQQLGYRFRFPTAEHALQQLLSK